MNIYEAKFCQDKRFYGYQYLRSKKSKYGEVGTTYYVGKGCGRRSKHYMHSVRKPKNSSNIILTDLMNEADAFQWEMLKIYQCGRIDLRTGCLRNLTDGGEGKTGIIHTTKTKRKISISLQGHFVSDETKRKISNTAFGSTHSQETKEKMSKAKKGRPQSEETKRKISYASKGRISGTLGKKYSDESKHRMSIAQFRRYGKIPKLVTPEV
jgi:hypothetical protein